MAGCAAYFPAMMARMKWSGCGLLVCILLLSGCGSDAPNEQSAPEFAFRSFRSALASRNHDAVWSFLGPENRAALEDRAEEFDAAGVPVEHPAGLLVAAWLPSEADIETVTREEFTETHAVLRIETIFEEEFTVEMTRDGAAWRIELAIPSIEESDE
jgi:hypothetical protein